MAINEVAEKTMCPMLSKRAEGGCRLCSSCDKAIENIRRTQKHIKRAKKMDRG